MDNPTKEEVIKHFDFDNMSKEESGFCPLYRDFTKCHVTNKLNCLLCACPHFKYSDSTPLVTHPDGTKVMSMCSIGSKQSKTFTVDKITHCDCSECLIPHKEKYVTKELADIQDGYSILEHIRTYQLKNCMDNIQKDKK